MANVLITVIIIVTGLVVLYYLYQYLFAAGVPVVNVISSAQAANIIGPSVTSLPPLYTGGQFSISTWIYISNMGYSNGYNAPILTLGDGTNDTLRVFISPDGKLCTRITAPASGAATASPSDTLFTGLAMGATTPSSYFACDVPNLDLQRWINIVVALNGTLCDVYMDGKLVRSCALPNYFLVGTAPTLKMTPNLRAASAASTPGFGGVIAATNIYGLALSPDVVYSNYMAGPNPVANFYQYLSSFFQPSTLQ